MSQKKEFGEREGVTYTVKGLEVETCFLVWWVQGSGLTSEVKVPVEEVESETGGGAVCWAVTPPSGLLDLLDLLGTCNKERGREYHVHTNF